MRRVLHTTTPISSAIYLTPPEGTIWKIHILVMKVLQSTAGTGSFQVNLRYTTGNYIGLGTILSDTTNDVVINNFSESPDLMGSGNSPTFSRPIEFGSDAEIEIVPASWGTVTVFDLMIQILERGA